MIPHFATTAVPLTDLLRKNIHYTWSEQCQTAFDSLKKSVKDIMPLKAFDKNARDAPSLSTRTTSPSLRFFNDNGTRAQPRSR